MILKYITAIRNHLIIRIIITSTMMFLFLERMTIYHYLNKPISQIIS